MRLAIRDLNALGYLDSDEAQFVPTIGCELFAFIADAPPVWPPGRVKLAKRERDDAFQAGELGDGKAAYARWLACSRDCPGNASPSEMLTHKQGPATRARLRTDIATRLELSRDACSRGDLRLPYTP